MNSLISRSKKLVACGISAGLLAASTLAYAQDGGWPQAPDRSPQAENGAGPEANPYGQPPEPPEAGEQSPAPEPQQQQPYGQPPYAQQQPPQQRPYGQQSQQQPYGGGVYNQQAPTPVPAQITVPAGTYVTARLNNRLASDRNQPGDAFTATLVQLVVVSGVVVAEPGQTITGQVVEARKVDGSGRLAVQLTELPLVDGQRMPIQTQLIGRKGDRFRGSDAAAVAGTTALGAAIGGAVDWGTGAAIGAGAGALISLGAILTHGHASVLFPEEVLTFRIQQPLTISTTAAPQAFRYVEPGEYNSAPPPSPNMRTGYPYPAPAPPPPTYYAYGYGYPGYAYGYPYYGPSVGFYFGGPAYYRGYYGRRYYGRPYYHGGYRGHR
jgi:hypothetical protein